MADDDAPQQPVLELVERPLALMYAKQSSPYNLMLISLADLW
jgi:hypothetical protein